MSDTKQDQRASDGGIFSIDRLKELIGSDFSGMMELFGGCFERGIILCRNDYNLTVCFSSVPMRRISGCMDAEFLRLTESGLIGLMHPSCRTAVRESIKNVQKDSALFTLTFQVNLPDKDVWLKAVGKHIELPNVGSVVAMECENVTHEYLESENSRLREEELNIAINHCNVDVMRYDPEKKRLYWLNNSRTFGLGKNLEYLDNVPDILIINGHVPDSSIVDLLAFFDAIRNGQPSESCVVRFNGELDSALYVRMSYTLVPGSSASRQAIITSENITELRKNELEFDSWSRINEDMRLQSSEYALYNLTKEKFIYVHWTHIAPTDTENLNYSDVLWMDLVARYVFPDDQKRVLRFLNRERLLNAFSYDVNEGAVEYRCLRENIYVWMRLKLRCIKKPGSGDVFVFAYASDISGEKRSAAEEYVKLNSDPLTGALREDVFRDRLSELFAHSEGSSHALFMVDIDNLGELNSRMGRLLCDNALKTLANVLRSTLRADDLIGRINGDEFFVCMKNVSPDDSLIKKAQFISSLLKVELSSGIFLTASIGVAAYPRNGETYEDLYKNASIALAEANKLGKNRFVIYQSYMFHDNSAFADRKSVILSDEDSMALPADSNPAGEPVVHDKASSLLNVFVNNMIGGMMLIEIGEKLNMFYISSGFAEIMQGGSEQTSADRICTLFPHIHPDDSVRMESLLRRAAQNDIPVEFVFRLVSGEETARWVQMRAVKVSYPEMSAPVVMTIIIDVTEQTQSTEHFKNVINGIPGGVGLYEYSDTLRPIMLGESLVSKRIPQVKTQAQKLIEADALFAVDEDDRARVAAQLRDWLKSRTNFEIEYHMNEQLYGPGRYTKVTCAKTGSMGKNILVTAVFSETTDQKKQELKLRSQHAADVALLMKLSHGLALSEVVLFEFDYDGREGEMLHIYEPYARSEVRHINLDETLERYVKNGYIHADSISKYKYIEKWVYEDNIPRARTKLLVLWPNEREYTNTRIAYLVDSEKGKPRTIYVAAWKVE